MKYVDNLVKLHKLIQYLPCISRALLRPITRDQVVRLKARPTKVLFPHPFRLGIPRLLLVESEIQEDKKFEVHALELLRI